MDRRAFLKKLAGAGVVTRAGGLATTVTVAGAAGTPGLERRAMDKVTWRLVPFLIVCFSIAYLDRVNIGFANATMSEDLALSASAFGGAAGIFFIGYFLFEVPSNLALNKFGARIWIARIMFTWGIISGAQRGPGPRSRRGEPQCCSFSAGRCRGWLCSRHHVFSDLVVPVGVSRAHRRLGTWLRSRSRP
jgi:hypothetical protein